MTLFWQLVGCLSKFRQTVGGLCLAQLQYAGHFSSNTVVFQETCKLHSAADWDPHFQRKHGACTVSRHRESRHIFKRSPVRDQPVWNHKLSHANPPSANSVRPCRPCWHAQSNPCIQCQLPSDHDMIISCEPMSRTGYWSPMNNTMLHPWWTTQMTVTSEQESQNNHVRKRHPWWFSFVYGWMGRNVYNLPLSIA